MSEQQKANPSILSKEEVAASLKPIRGLGGLARP